MKRYIFVLAAVLCLVPSMTQAAVFSAGENYFHPAGQVINENLYAAGNTAVISGEINGDVFIAGSTVSINGNVSQDVNAAGSNVQTTGEIGDDLRAAAGTMTIGNNIGGEAMLAGGMISVLPDVTIGGKLYAAGGMVTLGGTVNGDVLIESDEAVINGTINGNAVINSEVITLGPSAVINGNLKYNAAAQSVPVNSPQVLGVVEFTEISTTDRASTMEVDFSLGKMFALGGFLSIMKLFCWLVGAAAIMWLFRKQADGLVARGSEYFGWDLLRGLVMTIVIPIVTLLLFVTVVGIFVGSIMGITFGLMIMLAKVLGGMIFGVLVFALFNKEKNKKAKFELTWASALTGVALFWLVGLIPFVGWLARGVFILVALGAMGYLLYEYLWAEKVKKN